MRRRLIEILSAVIGVALVVAYYTDYNWFGLAKRDAGTASVPQSSLIDDTTGGSEYPPNGSPDAHPDAHPDTPLIEPAGLPTLQIDSAESPTPGNGITAGVEAGQSGQQSVGTLDPELRQETEQTLSRARTEINTITADLEQLDVRFDRLETAYAEREARGEDMEVLDDELMNQLEELVSQYQELEAILAEANAEEAAAMEILEQP